MDRLHTRATLAALFILLAAALVACEKKAEPADDKPGETPEGGFPNEKPQTTDQEAAAPPPAGGGDDAAPETAPTAGDGQDEPTSDPSYVVRMIAAASLKGDGSCIGEEAPMCAAVDEPPACEAGAADAALTVQELQDNHTAHLGKEVVVRGRLVAPSDGGCTEMACDRQCCNGCFGNLTFTASKGLPTRPDLGLVFDQGQGTAVQCKGDESGLCCATAPPAGDVLAMGRAEAVGTQDVVLRNATFCTL